MNDLPERLRHNSRSTSYRPGVDELMLEAADALERAEAELTQLREAAQRWLDHRDQRAHDGHVVEPGQRCTICDLRAALTQENPE